MRVEQVTKFQNQVDSAVFGYLNILKRKELLAVSIELNKSLACLEPLICKSILAIQDTLYSSLMVEVHAWLFDKSSNSCNLSLYGLLEKLADSKTNTKHLKSYYVKPPKTIDIGGANESWHQHFIEGREDKFEACFMDCKSKIETLLASEEAKKVISLRDKMLAHKDGHYDVKSNGHTVGDVFYLLENMKSILLDLSALMTRTSYPILQSEARAKVMAKKFGEHVART
ncbi:hypothetical protein [Shewanella frigidimarina]|uniref:AbiU2 domain-containing protein n=1 Tax=Shewanella frigidimarina TaxID=56812 RepID=UPI003D78DE9D